MTFDYAKDHKVEPVDRCYDPEILGMRLWKELGPVFRMAGTNWKGWGNQEHEYITFDMGNRRVHISMDLVEDTDGDIKKGDPHKITIRTTSIPAFKDGDVLAAEDEKESKGLGRQMRGALFKHIPTASKARETYFGDGADIPEAMKKRGRAA